MAKLVTSTAAQHRSTAFHFKSELIQHKQFVGDDSPNFIFLNLTTNKENFVLDLDTSEGFGDLISVSDSDTCCVLRSQVMDKQCGLFFVVVMKTGLFRL